MKDLYQSLEVSRDASQDEIKRSFRKLTSKYHPDRNPDDAAAEERFKQVSQAYDVLGDAEKRKDYDEFGEISLTQGFDRQRARAYRQAGGGRGFGGPGGGFGGGFSGASGGGYTNFGDFGEARSASFDDLLSKLFGGATVSEQGSPFGAASARSRKGYDIQGKVQVSLQEALLGTTVPLRISSEGQKEGRTLDVRIPAGVADGSKLRLRGQGGRGQPPGDVILSVEVQDGRYLKRSGHDLRLRLPVSALEAYKGAKVDVPTPWGTLALSLPPGSQSGQTLRLKGKGVKVKGEAKGDMLVTLEVQMPPAGDEKLLEALERLQANTNAREQLTLSA